MVEAREQQSATATRTIGVAGAPFLCSRSCHNRLFLSTAFLFTAQSSRSVRESIVIRSKSGCRVCRKSVVGVRSSVSSVSCEGCSFLGAPGAFGSLFSFSSVSSTSANPSGRVRDRDRRELSTSCICCCCCLWKGVTCVAGITVVDPEDSEGWGLHSGVGLSSITLLFLLKKLSMLMKIIKNLKRINKDKKKFA